MDEGWDREEDYERVREIAESFGRTSGLSEKEFVNLVGFGDVEISDDIRQSLGELKEHLTKYLGQIKSHEQSLEKSISILTNRLEMERNTLSDRIQKKVSSRIEDFKIELDLIRKESKNLV